MLNDLHEILFTGLDERGWATTRAPPGLGPEPRSKSKFRASLLWLVDMEAITLAQADRLKDICDPATSSPTELIKNAPVVACCLFGPPLNNS